ncbi:MAG: hypothetical protein O9302_08305 [Cyclobacteriaceae bacterium]|jgi:hypothetical protein|nr:hypothetical protein [Cytophagales bacterium]MCZ8328047.1 hypothetical protein [Cyclobacteriaceae bacterium]
MKTQTKMRVAFLSVLLLVFTSASSLNLIEFNNGKFVIELEKTETGLKLIGVKGTAFKELTFSLRDKYKQRIDEYGMVMKETSANGVDANLADFEFSIEKINNEYHLVSKKGTGWEQLKFTFSINNKAELNESGILVN